MSKDWNISGIWGYKASVFQNFDYLQDFQVATGLKNLEDLENLENPAFQVSKSMRNR